MNVQGRRCNYCRVQQLVLYFEFRCSVFLKLLWTVLIQGAVGTLWNFRNPIGKVPVDHFIWHCCNRDFLILFMLVETILQTVIPQVVLQAFCGLPITQGSQRINILKQHVNVQLDLFIFLMQQGSVWRAVEVSVASNVQFLVTDKQTTAKTQLTEKCGCSPLFRKSPGRVCKFKTKHQNIYKNAVLPSVLLPLGVCTDGAILRLELKPNNPCL